MVSDTDIWNDHNGWWYDTRASVMVMVRVRVRRLFTVFRGSRVRVRVGFRVVPQTTNGRLASGSSSSDRWGS